MRLVVASLLLCGCAYQPELMVGCGPRMVEGHLEGACELRLQQRFGEHGYCAYTHGSEPQDGRGGDRAEPDVDTEQTSCGLRWGGQQR